MNSPVETIDINGWRDSAARSHQERATTALESGNVLYFPHLEFVLEAGEREFLSPRWADGRAKNISFDPVTGTLRHSTAQGGRASDLAQTLARFADSARALVLSLCPGYEAHLEFGLTSLRPVEVAGRASSPRKDDARLHVDAFTSRPNQGRRILRVFANVDPGGQPRVWEVGEPFEAVARRYATHVSRQLPGSAWLLARLGITRGRRSPYDHVMLNLHDRSKLDEDYQRTSARTRVEFPAGSAWMCYTDQVMHAALAGQHAFEQTFYLPVAAMRSERLSPLRVLERLFARPLV